MHFLSQLNVPHIQGGFFTLAGEDSQPHMNVAHYSMHSVQFSSVAQSRPTLCDPTDCSTPGFPVHHQFSELTPTHVHRVSDAIQPSHPLKGKVEVLGKQENIPEVGIPELVSPALPSC